MLGQILVERGYVTLAQLNEARRKQLSTEPEDRSPLGEILVEMGALTPVQLEKGLEMQKMEREIIGQQPAKEKR